MLPDTPEVKDVLFGENGVSFGLSKGKLVIDMSSISPIETKDFARKIRASGAESRVGLDELAGAVRVVSPDARVAIRLQLHAHLVLIRFFLRTRLLLSGAHLAGRA